MSVDAADQQGAQFIRTPFCRCGHLLTEHRTDLKVAACGHGCGVPGLACDCREYQEATDAE